ncbi:hypothetical protein ACTFIZ_010080 [Dictyostelium cf. discoideum]
MDNKPYKFIDRNSNIIKRNGSYENIYKSFKYEIPEYFNIGLEVCDYYANDPNKMNNIAIKHIYDTDDKQISQEFTFKQIQIKSNQLANKFKEIGLNKKGEVVGVFLTQGIECALSHITILRSGLIGLLLSVLFGPEALEHRISSSSASCVITDLDNIDKLLKVVPNLPNLKKIIVFGDNLNSINSKHMNIIELWNEKISNKYSNEFEPIITKSNEPAYLVYTSGTTGLPKGCLHAHRVLIGNMVGVQFSLNLFHQKKPLTENCYYSPADWAWVGGLFVVFLPSLYFGVPLLTYKSKGPFDAKKLLTLLKNHNVTMSFLTPSVLKMMKFQKDQLRDLKINTMLAINSGGESLGENISVWSKDQFGVEVAEFIGQSEGNFIIGNCLDLFPQRNGSMGKPIPGNKVKILNDNGDQVPYDEVGNICIEFTGDNASQFLGYWNDQKSTEKKMIFSKETSTKWIKTGDLAKEDKDGYFWYIGRNDDVINSSGYRIGPNEIEGCLLKHPLILNVAVIGIPDEIRGEVVKAYIVLNQSVTPSQEIKKEIQNYVKTQLSAHQYPREIEFINQNEMPMTTTGKIMRNSLRQLHKMNSNNNNKSKL